MTDERGTFEHALFSEPRPEHGFCTDDMARVLVVATREPEPGSAVRDLALLSLRFLLGALDAAREVPESDGPIWIVGRRPGTR